MNNPTAVTVDLPPRLLDLLEAYVRARSATLDASAQCDEGLQENRAVNRSIYRAAESEEQRLADLVLFKLILEMRELGLGTLGDTLNEYWAKHARAVV